MKQVFDQFGRMILAVVILCIAFVLLYGVGGHGGTMAKIANTFYKEDSGLYSWTENSSERMVDIASSSDPIVKLTDLGSGDLYTNTDYDPNQLFDIRNAKNGRITLNDNAYPDSKRSFIEKVVDSYDGNDVSSTVLTYGLNGGKDVSCISFPENHKYWIYFRVYDTESNRNCNLKISVSLKKAGLFRSDGTIIYNWKQLKDQEYIAVDETGVLSGGVNKTALTGVLIIDDSVTKIANNAFENCDGLSDITIPGSVLTIGDAAFSGCTQLSHVMFIDGIKNIGVSAFSNCTMLSDIALPETLQFLGSYAFENCTSVYHIDYKNTGVGTKKDIEDILDANGVDYVKTAFNNTSLEGQAVASGIYAADRSFVSWNQLKEDGIISVDGNGILSSDASKKTTLSGEFIIDPEVKGLYDAPSDTIGVFSGCKNLTNIIIPDSVVTIGRSAFYGCSGLKSITIPDSVVSIEEKTFANCSGIETVMLSGNITTIPKLAFMNCSSLKNITLPNKVTYIGDSAFTACTCLQSLEIPDNIQQLGTAVFNGCSNLKTVLFNGVTYMSKDLLLQALTNRNVAYAANTFDGIGMGK